MNDFLGNIWLLVLRNRAFEGNPFEVVFAKPCLGGDLVCKDLQVILVSNLLARVDLNPNGHH
jgi:hypothetical protein